MPIKGHRPIRNTDPPLDEKAEVVLEAAQPRILEESLLPNYVPVRSRRARSAEVINEAFAPERESSETTLLDAADGSYADTMVLEAVIGNDDRTRVADAFLGTNPWRQICALRIHASTGSTSWERPGSSHRRSCDRRPLRLNTIKENGWATRRRHPRQAWSRRTVRSDGLHAVRHRRRLGQRP